VTVANDWLPFESVALTEQIRTVAKDRLTEYMGTLSDKQMQAVEQAMLCCLDIVK